jgi:hypothetical protein
VNHSSAQRDEDMREASRMVIVDTSI